MHFVPLARHGEHPRWFGNLKESPELQKIDVCAEVGYERKRGVGVTQSNLQ